MRAIDAKVINIDELKLEHFAKGDKFSPRRAHRATLLAGTSATRTTSSAPASSRTRSTVIAARRRCSSSCVAGNAALQRRDAEDPLQAT
jgi:alkylhydroperoxidase family enzyme